MRRRGKSLSHILDEVVLLFFLLVFRFLQELFIDHVDLRVALFDVMAEIAFGTALQLLVHILKARHFQIAFDFSLSADA